LDSHLKEMRGGLELARLGPTVARAAPRLLQMAIDVSMGMAYLSTKKFIHRDLAVRNILLAHDGTCKIGDFGMAREGLLSDYYSITDTKKIPIRWTAPEALFMRKYSTHADIWSFGIVLYEMWTLGERPYPGWRNDKVLAEIVAGHRMQSPAGTPLALYAIMMDTWHPDHKERPSFDTLTDRLLALAGVLAAAPPGEVAEGTNEEKTELARRYAGGKGTGLYEAPTDVADTYAYVATGPAAAVAVSSTGYHMLASTQARSTGTGLDSAQGGCADRTRTYDVPMLGTKDYAVPQDGADGAGYHQLNVGSAALLEGFGEGLYDNRGDHDAFA